MGRKVHPIGFRLKINKTWDSRLFASGEKYADQLHEDREIREMVFKMSPRAGISRVEIERYPNSVHITVHTAKPGIVIGRKGANVKALRKELQTLTGTNVKLDIAEIRQSVVPAYQPPARHAARSEFNDASGCERYQGYVFRPSYGPGNGTQGMDA
jgi:small subunit ribosomal protein S3